jgi:hypothetical protein
MNQAEMYRRAGLLPIQPARSDEKGAPNGSTGQQRT